MLQTIETERLRLRPWREDDHAALATFYASEESRFVGGPLSIADTWRRIAMFIGHRALRGFGNWVVEEKATRHAVGYAGLWQPYGWPEPEIVWTVYDGFRGKGYATEAARRARDHAFGDLDWPKAVSYINPENVASRRVAQRLGAERDPDIKSPGGHEVWRHAKAAA